MMSDTKPDIDWPNQIHALLKKAGVSQVSFVPDGGHKKLIELCFADESIRTISLTTEEEGIALAAGAWLGGARSAHLMQSSGVGNCINMLTLMKNGQFPFLTFVTMRGDFGEENPWQIPMGQAAQATMEAVGVTCLKVPTAEEVEPVVAAGIKMAFNAMQPVAILLSQRLIGAKAFK
jgi:sulfopyruvate decarboxylase alpha subunit